MKKIRIFLEYLAAFLLVSLLLFAIASVIVIKYYGDEVKEYTMNLVNEQVDTKIYIGEMGISVFRKFPYTSVFLNDVTVWSGHGFNRSDFENESVDTLFTAESIFLKFNLIDLARKKYTLKNVEARNGVIRLFTDSQGQGNYTVSKGSSGNVNPFLIDLKELNIKNYKFSYINKYKSLDVILNVENILLEGNFSRENYELKTTGSARIHSLKNNGIQYLSDQSIKTNVSLQVKENLYTISRGEVELGSLITAITGEFLVAQEGVSDLNLKIAGKKVDIAWLLDILKKNGVTGVEKISGSGKIDLQAEISGLASSVLTPHINSSFSTQEAMLNITDFPYPLKSINISGSFNNGLQNSGSTSNLEISFFKARMSDSEITGSLVMQNFRLPRFTLSVSGNIELDDLIQMFPDFPLDNLRGIISPDIQVDGLIRGLGTSKPGISFIPKGNISIADASFGFNHGSFNLEKINGALQIGSSSWKTTLSCVSGESDFALDATSSNLLNYFLNNEGLEINATLNSSFTDIDNLLSGLKNENEGVSSFHYPENIGIRLAFNFNEIRKGQVIGQNVIGRAHYSFPSFYIDTLHAETMNGLINAKVGFYNLNEESIMASVSSNFKNLEIDRLFSSFNNFGQEFLTYDNIKGELSGNAEFSAPIKSDFSIESPRINLDSNIKIEDGELNDFQPMIEMSKFLKIEKMDHIVFSTIENTILIRKNTITIPEMDIHSNALNISASGTHSFDNKYKYHLAIKLSEVLFKKAQNSANKEFEVALDENDRRTIFLILYDEGKGMMIEFDEEQAIKKIKNDLKEERKELKFLLNEEFGLFKEDEAVKRNAIKEESPMFKFDFTDEEPLDTSPAPEEKKAPRWKMKKENKKSVDFVIEDDLTP